MSDTHQIRLRPVTVKWLREFMSQHDLAHPDKRRMTYDEAVQALIRRAAQQEDR